MTKDYYAILGVPRCGYVDHSQRISSRVRASIMRMRARGRRPRSSEKRLRHITR